MKNKRGKHVLAYVYMPICLAVCSGVLLCYTLQPIAARYYAEAKMVLTQGSPEYTNELVNSLSSVDLKQGNNAIPAMGTHYANLTSLDVAWMVPVYYGDSNEILNQGAGQYIGSSLPGMGKPILIGGHDSTYFKPLQQIKKGNILTVSTNYGFFDYRVRKITKAKATDESVYDLSVDKETLILYTCYPFGRAIGDSTQRYFVFADRIFNAK